jgi:uncharacterized protein with HEPN domain
LSDEFKDNHPSIPWSKIKGLRNIAAHQYEHVDFVLLWNTLVDRVPELKECLLSLGLEE